MATFPTATCCEEDAVSFRPDVRLKTPRLDRHAQRVVGDRPPVDTVREQFAVIDATIERLTVEAAGSPRGLAVVRDEADGWLGSFSKYTGKAGGSDVPNWLSLYEAGPIRRLRRTGEPRQVEACGGIQSDFLKAAMSDPAFVASGLTARVGFTFPPGCGARPKCSASSGPT